MRVRTRSLRDRARSPHGQRGTARHRRRAAGPAGHAPRARPAHRVTDAEAATRAMVVLHATEPATVHLAVAARTDGRDGRRRRPGALRRPVAGQAAGDAADPVRVPAGPAAGSLGERLRPGRRGRAEADRRQRRDRRPGRRRRCLARRPPARGPRPARLRGPAGCPGAARTAARPRREGHRLGRLEVGRPGPHRPAGARLAGCPRRHGPRRQRRTLAALPPPLDADARVAGGAAAARPRGRRLRRAGRPLAGQVRSRHRDRPGLVAGLDQDRRTPRPRRPGRAYRSRSTPATPAGCCPRTSTPSSRRAGGGPAARRSTRRRWAGSSAASTSTPTTCRSTSTPPATPAPPPGGTGGSSAAGCRTTRAGCASSSAATPGARTPGALDDEAERLTAWLDGQVVGNIYKSRR